MSAWLVGIAALGALGVQEPVLTLDEALKIAESNAFSVKLAESSVEKAQQLVRQTKAQVGPKLTAGATYTRFDEAITADFGGGGATTIRPIDQSSGTITFSLPVLFSRSVNLGISAARTGVNAAKASLDASKNTLKLNVRQSYYRAVQAKWQVDVAKETVANAEKRLANAIIREKAGELAKIDVLRFQTEVAQRKGELVAAQNGLDLAKSALNNALGRPIETPFITEEIAGTKPEVESQEKLAKLAAETRPEIQALKLQHQTYAAIRKSESYGMDPSLSLSVTHSRNLGIVGFGGSDASTTGVLAISLPLYDSGLVNARKRLAEQDERQAKVRLDQTILGVSLEVRQATINLSNALAQLEIATQQEALAAETYRLAVVRYEAGEGIQLEVIDAQTQLTAARTAHVAARYNVLTTYAQLQAAVGTDALPNKSMNLNGDNK